MPLQKEGDLDYLFSPLLGGLESPPFLAWELQLFRNEPKKINKNENNCDVSGQLINIQQVKNTPLLFAFVQNAMDNCGESNTDEILPQEAQSLARK